MSRKTTKHTPDYNHAQYLENLVPTENLKKSIRNAVKVLKRFKFDAIAFRGMSGALIAPALAVRLNKTLLMVRKPVEKAHSRREVEGDAGARTYIIVDDFIATGETARTIVDLVKDFAPQAVCLGVLEVDKLWNDDEDDLVDPSTVSLNIEHVGSQYWLNKNKVA